MPTLTYSQLEKLAKILDCGSSYNIFVGQKGILTETSPDGYEIEYHRYCWQDVGRLLNETLLYA